MQLGMALLVLIHNCVAAFCELCVRCSSNTWIRHLLSGAYVRLTVQQFKAVNSLTVLAV